MQAEAPEMFALKMLRGTRSGLKDPSSMLVSAGLAKALFGDAEPMNQVIKIDNKFNVKVTGVYEDLPRNTSFNDMAFMLPWDFYLAANPWTKRRREIRGEKLKGGRYIAPTPRAACGHAASAAPVLAIAPEQAAVLVGPALSADRWLTWNQAGRPSRSASAR